ncbi:hypothetical protein ALO86_200016 [Pseudomonas syringae pv. berberidis]|nr:Unknown protein sequence [Pseudomonas syringae pv. maculicola]KPW44510.1 hypothetical protein ALO86_200016 [Pseudomonas syringae pv. berberidis]
MSNLITAFVEIGVSHSFVAAYQRKRLRLLLRLLFEKLMEQ